MEVGPKRPSLLWFWGPSSIMVLYTEPLGLFNRVVHVSGRRVFRVFSGCISDSTVRKAEGVRWPRSMPRDTCVLAPKFLVLRALRELSGGKRLSSEPTWSVI